MTQKTDSVTFGKGVRSYELSEVERIHDALWKGLDLVGGFILRLDRQGVVIEISDGGAELLGLPVESVVGRNWFDEFTPERARKQAKEIHERIFSDGNVFSEHHSLVVDDKGHEMDVHWHDSVVVKDGVKVGTFSHGHVSVLFEAKKDSILKNLILDSATDKFILTDIKGTIVYANEAVNKIGGWDTDKIRGKSVFGTILEDDDDISGLMRERLSRGEMVTIQINLRRSDGSGYPAQVSAHPVSLEGERFAIMSFRDMRQIISAQEALAASERRYKAFVENTKDIVVTLDKDGRFTYLSPQAEKYGVKPLDMMGRPFSDLVFEEDRQTTRDFNESGPPEKFRVSGESGEIFWFELSGDFLSTSKKNRIGWVGTLRDVTDRVASETEATHLSEAGRQMAEIGSRLLSASLEEMGDIMNGALKTLCAVIRADGVEVAEIFPDRTLRHSYVWVKDGIGNPCIRVSSVDDTPEMAKMFSKGEPVLASPVSEVEGPLKGDFKNLCRPENQSVIVMPFMISGRLAGIVSAFADDPDRRFGKRDEDIMRLFAGLVGSAIVNKNSLDRLALEADWDKALSNLSVSLLSGADTEEGFAERFSVGMPPISRVIDFDRATLFSFDGPWMRVAANWDREGLDVEPVRTEFLRDEVRGIMEDKDREGGRVAVIGDVSVLPDKVKEILAKAGGSPRLMSFMSALMISDSKSVGLLLFLSYDEPGKWNEYLSSRARAVADLLTSAVIRRQALNDLDHRLKLESAVSEAVADLTKARHDSLQYQAAQAMSRLVDALGADGAGFYYIGTDQKVKSYATWQREGSSLELGFHGLESLSEGSLSLQKMSRGEELWYTAAEKSVVEGELATYDPRSAFICIPTVRDGKLTSIFCLGATSEVVKSWSRVDTLPLRTFGDAMFTSFARIRSEEAMKELERLRVKFIHVVSHQLRTPLNSIRWSLEALLAGELGEMPQAQKDFIRVVYDSEMKIIARIRDMITALDIEEGRVSLVREECLMESLWGSVMSSLEGRAKRANIQFTYEAPSQPLPQVYADTAKVRFAMEAIVTNALSYTKTGGQVTVRMFKQDNVVRFEVSDNGIGIPKVEQKTIFNRFSRASNASVMVQDASGLSLSIAKYYIDRHGGDIGFTSEQEKGSVFWFTIPIN